MINFKMDKSRDIARRTAWCCCRYVSKFTAASRGFRCDSTAFVLKIELECVAKPSLMAARPLNWSKSQLYLSPFVDQSTRAPQRHLNMSEPSTLIINSFAYLSSVKGGCVAS